MYKFWIFLHLLGIVIWVGGMFFVQLALRPALADMAPQVRLPLMVQTLGNFFKWVVVAIVLILLSGVVMLSSLSGMRVPVAIHLMSGLGVLMMLIFGHLRFVPYMRLKRTVAASQWSQASPHLAQIRLMVAINLCLGLVVMVIATVGRM